MCMPRAVRDSVRACKALRTRDYVCSVIRDHVYYLHKRTGKRADPAGMLVTYNGKRIRLRRALWGLHTGTEVPAGGYVTQTCGDRLCHNPDHMIVLSMRASRALTTKRNPPKSDGGYNGRAKLNYDDVDAIREWYLDCATRHCKRGDKGAWVLSMANRYGVSVSAVESLMSGKTWAHYEPVMSSKVRAVWVGTGNGSELPISVTQVDNG